MITSNKIKALANISYSSGNFQEVILKILADIIERLEDLDSRLNHVGTLNI